MNYLFGLIKYNISRVDRIALFLFIVFLFSSLYSISTIPGLLGDEGDEGHNVQELLTGLKSPIQGERSYIGVWIDYLRIPFLFFFGHDTFSLRIPIVLFSCLLFWITYGLLKKHFGKNPAYYGLSMFAFSPIYWTEMRIGWAITLLPFFTALTIFFLQQQKKWSPLLAGLAAGFGLSTHILFLPTLVTIVLFAGILKTGKLLKNFKLPFFKRILFSIFSFFTGFWSIFSFQFLNLLVNTGDQGNIEKTSKLFMTRLDELFSIAPRFMSGSLFIAQYTSKTFRDNTSLIVTSILLFFIVCGFVFEKKRWHATVILLGSITSFIILVYMIEYYAIRYLASISLQFWLLAGIGIGSTVERFFFRVKWIKFGAIFLSIILTVLNYYYIIFPFSATGGSNDTFPIIGESRFEYASGRVKTDDLVRCIKNLDQIFSNSVHIRNRLYYWADGDNNIRISKLKQEVRWLIEYRMPNDKIDPEEVCPYLLNFKVLPVTDRRQVDWPKE